MFLENIVLFLKIGRVMIKEKQFVMKRKILFFSFFQSWKKIKTLYPCTLSILPHPNRTLSTYRPLYHRASTINFSAKEWRKTGFWEQRNGGDLRGKFSNGFFILFLLYLTISP